jgi:hypothetical protein
MVVEIDILLAPLGSGETEAAIRYTYTALGEQGRESLEQSTEQDWHRMMDWWETSMNHYLKTGERLRRT